jgi:predicted nucleic acid-binding protein
MESEVKNKTSEIMKTSFQISVISKMEFLGFPFNSDEKEQAVRLLEFASIKPLNDEIVQRVIEIRQEKRIKLPDAIIAATATEYNSILVTRNTSDFKLLNLETYNPFD